jgi:hypothetical protein
MRRVLLAVVVTAATLMMMASPAHAGGPTSVLLTSPGTARAAALYYTDPRYAELEALLHGQEADASETTTHYPGAAEDSTLNVTWLVHDVSIWRTDQLVLGGTGGSWVATLMPLDDGSLSAGRPTWRALDNGDRIKTLVSSLGLLGQARSKDAGNPQPATGPVWVPPLGGVDDAGAANPADAAPAEPRAETRWFTLTGWRWAAPGLLLGLFAGLAIRRNGRAGSGPRQEFIDVESERATAPG